MLERPGRFRLEEVAPVSPGPGQVRVRVQGCGICASSLPVWEGRDWFRYPLPPGAPGHEGWGIVEEVGPGVEGLPLHSRVAFLSERAYAEHEVVPASSAVLLPEALDGRPFPGEALGCGMNVFRRAEVEPGQAVAVVGAGFLGALVTQLAARAGARVFALSRRAFARELALAMGAEQALPLEPASVEALMEATGGAGCERVVEAAGLQATLDLASALVRERGRLVIAGYHQDGLRTVDMQSWNWRGLDVVNAHERDPARYVEGMRAAVEAVVAGRLDPWPLLSHAWPLEEINRAFEAADSRPPGFVKAVVTL